MLIYYLIAPILLFLGNLPSSVLYKFASGIGFILYRIVGYRKAVVQQNIANSFPEKSASEKEKIAQDSYQHLADRIVENLKCLSISKEEVHNRIEVTNIELMHEYYRKNKSVVVLLGHIGSWELGGYKASLILKHKTYGLVSLLTNPHFNDLIQRTRGKMGMHLVGMKHAKDFFEQPLTQPSTIIFIGDQSPSNPQNAYWTNFLNQDTAFFTGGERYARKHDCAVVYVAIKQVKRGYYNIEVINICDDVKAIPENEVTQSFIQMLEKTLRENPSDWLWSHKRWKHKRAQIQH
jgi:Kdo2-lipid IVA lauroyltransferase/acyltransferase